MKRQNRGEEFVPGSNGRRGEAIEQSKPNVSQIKDLCRLK